MRNLIGGLLAALLVGPGLPASAHEMFLKPKKHVIAPNTELVIELVNGTFERSDNTIDRNRMLDVSILGGGEARKADAADWRDVGDTSVLTKDVGAAGTYAVGVSTKPRMITMAADDFARYLKNDGVADTLKEFTASGPKADVRERYSKHVRTIVQVGDERSSDFANAFGYPVEIVLETNPHDAAIGDEVAFKVLRNGEPVPNQLVYASYGGYHQNNDEGEHKRAQTIRTDDGGRGKFSLSKAAVWYLTLIHMRKLESDPEADYESNWATVTFEID